MTPINSCTLDIIMKTFKNGVIHHKKMATINYRNFGKIRNPSELRVI